MFILVRALLYATLVIGFGLVFLPGRILSWTGIVSPSRTGPSQVVAVFLMAAGALVVLSCLLAFVSSAREPRRRLILRVSSW